ncbi:MAG: DUF2231 domain-containing protein [Pyrinomonadaceae bacterium]|nr:DUF2231 domain-containing protein [Pyrinomonadaceae bacterium]
MEGKAKILGHSVHPMLIVFPLGLLSTAVIFDVVYLLTSDRTFATVAYWLILAGIIGGLVAAVFGYLDWTKIPDGTRAKSVGVMHATANVVTLALFAGSLYFRSGAVPEPGTLALVLSFSGAATSLVGGWLGGELVERLGIAVHEGANPDAPSSLETDRVPGVAAELGKLRKVKG